MKGKRNVVVFVVASFVALILCLPAAQVMAGGNYSGVTTEYKQTGPQVKGSLIVAWKFTETKGVEPYTYDVGTIEAHIIVDGKLYAAVMKIDYKESDFLDPSTIYEPEEAWKLEITSWEYPTEIAIDNNMPTDTLVTVFEEKDISNFGIKVDLLPVAAPGVPNVDLTYSHLVYCDVKITFFLPK